MGLDIQIYLRVFSTVKAVLSLPGLTPVIATQALCGVFPDPSATRIPEKGALLERPLEPAPERYLADARAALEKWISDHKEEGDEDDMAIANKPVQSLEFVEWCRDVYRRNLSRPRLADYFSMWAESIDDRSETLEPAPMALLEYLTSQAPWASLGLEAQSALASSGEASEIPTSNERMPDVSVHKQAKSGRRCIIEPAIRIAQDRLKVDRKYDANAVWAELVNMAKSGDHPTIFPDETGGIAYLSSKKKRSYSIEALRKFIDPKKAQKRAHRVSQPA
ncbi:hypothetical protein [Ideonella sp.]|uniref:hypothetical protein n=1 Tax=Ideonella sp. TaxID=1929293 RepID=UPI003BB57E64